MLHLSARIGILFFGTLAPTSRCGAMPGIQSQIQSQLAADTAPSISPHPGRLAQQCLQWVQPPATACHSNGVTDGLERSIFLPVGLEQDTFSSIHAPPTPKNRYQMYRSTKFYREAPDDSVELDLRCCLGRID
jgi:hypothetical protein